MPVVAIGMTENRKVSIQIKTGAFADFLPDIIRRNWFVRKDCAAGVGLGLKTEHTPDVSPFRIGEIPAKDFRHIADVATRHCKTESIFKRPAGFFADAPG